MRFCGQTHPQGEVLYLKIPSFSLDQELSEGHGLCSFISNHEYPLPWTLTSPAWPQTYLVTGDVPGDPAGGHDFICMGSLDGSFGLSEVVTLVRKEIKFVNISHSSAY